MTRATRVLVHGASGRMGARVLRLALADSRLQVVAAVTRSGGSLPDADAVAVVAAEEIERAPAFEVAIDFSLPGGFDRLLRECQRRGAALVSGTTGLADAQTAALEAAAVRIPIILAANFSLGVAVLTALTRRAAATLSAWECAIVESHHVHKRDAPSGTALLLAAEAEAGSRHAPQITSVRAGDLVGDHRVTFVGPDERLELAHHAGDRDVFARGALACAVWLAGRAPGRYAIADVLENDPG